MNELHEAANAKNINSTLASDATLLLSESSGEVCTLHNNPVCITININDILRMTYMQLKNAHIIGHLKNAKQNLRSL